MRVVAVAAVKNESDIVEAFVRHNLAIVDHLVVMDNGSTDDTREILRSLENDGLPLSNLEDATLGKYQSRRMTRLMRDHAVARFGADWVMPLDADEFIVPHGDGPVIPETADDHHALGIPWLTYVPTDNDDRSELNPVRRIRRRLAREAHPWSKVLIPRRIATLPSATIKHGNHEVLSDGKAVPAVAVASASLAHFPIRGNGQHAAKVAVTALQYMAMPDRKMDWGWHYRKPYDELKQDPDSFAANFQEAAARYAAPPGTSFEPVMIEDPLAYRGGPLRYTVAVDDTHHALLAVLNYAEDLAGKFAILAGAITDHEHVALGSYAHERAQLVRQLARQDSLIRQLQMELDDCKARLHEHQRLLREPGYLAKSVTEKLHRSWTWRIGRCVVAPFALLKGSLQVIGAPKHESQPITPSV